ncbi:MAG: sulfite exporter TauE/SafE family protein, partial [Pseudomonadota bacterium]
AIPMTDIFEAFDAVSDIERFWPLLAGAGLSGLVRGFSGFGTAMIFIPIAAQVLPPIWVLTAMVVMDIFGPLPAVPQALREGQLGDIARLGLATLICLPFGVFVLKTLPFDTFRYGVSIITLMLLAMLIGGLRQRRPISRPLLYTTGGIAGMLGGSVGLAGPPVILLYMSSPLPVARIRANTLLFLVLAAFAMLFMFAANGLLELTPILIGLGLVVPYTLATMIGVALFDPNRETLYRRIGYVIIAASAIIGLPLFD